MAAMQAEPQLVFLALRGGSAIALQDGASLTGRGWSGLHIVGRVAAELGRTKRLLSPQSGVRAPRTP